MSAVRLGTRRSALAVAQSRQIADALTAHSGREVELVFITTTGDVSRESLSALGGTGVFASALRDALLRGEIDIAVHSLKDLPTAAVPGLEIVALPTRDDPRDVLIARDGLTLDQLPVGSTIGTGSPRRAAQLRALRPDINIVDIRGNVDTRLGYVADGTVDAVVLAQAGLSRLGRLDAVTQVFEPTDMLPAPGQGALAVEARDAGLDDDLQISLRSLDDAATRGAVTAERAVLAALEAGCSAPVGALAVVDKPGFTEPELHLAALIAATDGSTVRRLSITATVTDAETAGRQLAERLLSDGVVVS
ncbi:MAG TPA: hydroxymethylbilane synthase [Actinomycetes bacterium]|nr:hydroxymethylbilane synthase [Actinomycetes bacterium]